MTCFEFLCPLASGLASQGQVSFAIGSAVNTAFLLVEQTRVDGSKISTKDAITIWALSESTGTKFEVFRGLVSRVSPEGAFVRIEAATASGAASVTTSKPMSWSNASVSRILLDLLAMSSVDASSASWPEQLSETIMHVWHSDGASVLDEIQELLQASGVTFDVYGAPDGRLYIGSPDQLQTFFPLFAWPFNAAFGDTDTDISRFPLRPAMPYQPAFDQGSGEAMGLVDVVMHTIDLSGSYTTILLADEVSPVVQARVATEVVPVEPQEPPSAEDPTDG